MFKLFLISALIPFFSFAQSVIGQTDSDLTSSGQLTGTNEFVVDSELSLEEALSGVTIPETIKHELTIITVYHYSFDNLLHQGQLVVNKKVADDVIKIFNYIRESKFPVEKVIPLNEYKWSDYKSMEDNNTSCFNYRFVSGSRVLSLHAYGSAIDINPRLNPYIKNKTKIPANAAYDPEAPGTLTSDSELVKEFKKLGWSWGGDWKSIKDYQHFQKELDHLKNKQK